METTNTLPILAGETEGIRVYEINGEMCMSAEDLGRCLGYADPIKGMDQLYQKHKDELSEWRFSPRIEGKTSGGRPPIFYYEEGIYVAGFLARTEVAKEFRKRAARLIMSLRLQRRADMQSELLNAYRRIDLLSRRKRNKVSDADKAEIIRLKKEGLSKKEIEEKSGWSRTTVKKHLRDARQLGLFDAPALMA